MRLPAYSVTEPPDDPPVTLAQAKTHLRVDFADDDAFITDAILAATDDIETYTGRYLIRRSVRARFPSLPADNCIQIRRAPYVAITDLGLWDGAGYASAETGAYLLEEVDFPHVFFPTRPAFKDDVLYPIQIDFTVGYRTEEDVPAILKQCVLEHVAAAYNERGDCQQAPSGRAANARPQMPPSVRQKLGRYRILRTFG
ncbi:MAG: head-tail connector protein [Pseudomonadota bacterium]